MDGMIEVLDGLCLPKITRTWSKWKELLALDGVTVSIDKSENQNSDLLSGSQARLAFAKCECNFESKSMSIDEWRNEYTRLKNTPPTTNDIITTEDGAEVALTIEYHEKTEPFIFARIYIPDIVGCELAYYAQSVNSNSSSGWKVILLPKARNAVIRKFGVTQSVVGVQSIRIISQSTSQKSFLGEVAQWT